MDSLNQIFLHNIRILDDDATDRDVPLEKENQIFRIEYIFCISLDSYARHRSTDKVNSRLLMIAYHF